MNQFGKCFSCGGAGHLARYCANNNYRNNNRNGHEHGRIVELTNMIDNDLALASSTQNQSISVEYCKEIALAVSDKTMSICLVLLWCFEFFHNSIAP